MAAFTDDEEELQVLVAYIEHQDQEIALEKLRYADAELEIRDLKRLLRARTSEVEDLQQQWRLKECRSRKALGLESQAGRQTMTNYCQELERIIEVLEERLSCNKQAQALHDTQVQLEEALSYASELEERLIESTRKWEERGSPLRTEGVAPAVLESLSMSPARWRPRKSVGTQARGPCACGSRQAWGEEKGRGWGEEEWDDVQSPPPAAAAMRRASVELSEARKSIDERDAEQGDGDMVITSATATSDRHQQTNSQRSCLSLSTPHSDVHEQIHRLTSELAQFKSLYKDSAGQVEDLRLLLRRAFYDQGHVFDASLDDDLTISSTDSRRFRSKRWLTGKVQELRKRLPKLKSATVHPVACPEDAVGLEDEDSSSNQGST